MLELVADCPRCGAKEHTFIVGSLWIISDSSYERRFESFCTCKHCRNSSIFHLIYVKDRESEKHFTEIQNKLIPQRNLDLNFKGSLNEIFLVGPHVNIRNQNSSSAPPFTPENIAKIFKEGSESLIGDCPNAAGAMFRLCVDLTTKKLLQETEVVGSNSAIKKTLYDKLKWLFEKNILPDDIEDFADCIRQDGNDGVHEGNLTMEDADDLMEFTTLLLDRVFTKPGQIEEAKIRRKARRNKE